MKIFGIGLSKTGTTSLASALQLLGYRTRDNMGLQVYRAGDISSLDLGVVDAHDALTDTPIPSFYRELDARYPKSKFILTVREREAWLQSCKKQFTQKLADKQNEAHQRLFVDLYGTDVFEEEQFARGYDRFVEGVTAYFRDRPGDLLVLDVAAGDGWAKLCPFLGVPQPDRAFPKANVTRLEWIDPRDVVRIARQAGAEHLRRRSLEKSGVLRRMIASLRGDDEATSSRTAAQRLVVAGLNALTPDIPVVTDLRDLVADGEERRLNHFWLIDPLDGEGEFRSGGTEFTINIALIQDGHPLVGVVYQPVGDIALLGRRGKPAARCNAGETIELIALSSKAEGVTQSGQDSTNPPVGKSVALRLCRLLGHAPNAMPIEQPAHEAELAAAHAVLNSAGMRLTRRNDGSEITYGGPEFETGALTVDSAERWESAPTTRSFAREGGTKRS